MDACHWQSLPGLYRNRPDAAYHITSHYSINKQVNTFPSTKSNSQQYYIQCINSITSESQENKTEMWQQLCCQVYVRTLTRFWENQVIRAVSQSMTSYKCPTLGAGKTTVQLLYLLFKSSNHKHQQQKKQKKNPIQSNNSMHHYECIALCKDISLKRGRFCARSLASYILRCSENRSSWMFFVQVVCSRPGGSLQFSGGSSKMAWPATAFSSNRIRCPKKVRRRDLMIDESGGDRC